MKLSIIVPLYKVESCMDKCIQSLLDQDIEKEEYEIILIDDGSPDHCYDIAKRYARQYGNIVALTQSNRGVSSARDRGLEVARGEYLCFVDPDDYVRSNCYQNLIRRMDEEGLDMLRFNYQMVDECHKELPRPKAASLVDYRPELMDGPTFLQKRLGYGCQVWAWMFRSALVLKNDIRYPAGVYYCYDDVDWLPKVLRKAERVDSIDEKIYYYVQRQGSLTHCMDKVSAQKLAEDWINTILSLHQETEGISDVRVVDWYNRMISASVLSLLSHVSEFLFDERRIFIKRLKQIRAFPLVNIHTTKNVQVKRVLANLSPVLFCSLLRVIQRFRH